MAGAAKLGYGATTLRLCDDPPGLKLRGPSAIQLHNSQLHNASGYLSLEATQ